MSNQCLPTRVAQNIVRGSARNRGMYFKTWEITRKIPTGLRYNVRNSCPAFGNNGAISIRHQFASFCFLFFSTGGGSSGHELLF
jgi:hypothetical protein